MVRTTREPAGRPHTRQVARGDRRRRGGDGWSGVRKLAPGLLVVASGLFAISLFVSMLGLLNH